MYTERSCQLNVMKDLYGVGSSRIYCASNGQCTKAPACLPSVYSEYPDMDGKSIEKKQSYKASGTTVCYFLHLHIKCHIHKYERRCSNLF